MAEVGILHEDDRVELIRGEILQLSPMGSRHQACVDRLTRLLNRLSDLDAVVRGQGPFHLPDNTEPVPDVALLKPREDFYAEAHPVPGDVLLLIEVSDTTLRYDRVEKLRLYAENGIPEYWVVDLTADKIEVYSRPVNGEYRNASRFGHGETVASSIIPDLSPAVDDVLGPPSPR